MPLGFTPLGSIPTWSFVSQDPQNGSCPYPIPTKIYSHMCCGKVFRSRVGVVALEWPPFSSLMFLSCLSCAKSLSTPCPLLYSILMSLAPCGLLTEGLRSLGAPPSSKGRTSPLLVQSFRSAGAAFYEVLPTSLSSCLAQRAISAWWSARAPAVSNL